MTHPPDRPPHKPGPRMSIAERYGLLPGAPYVAIPLHLLTFAVKVGLGTTETLVLIALLDQWRPDRGAGTCFPCSLTQIAALAPIDRARASRIVRRLADRGLIGVIPEPGRTTMIDIASLLILLGDWGRGVAPAQQSDSPLLLRGGPELLRPRNTTVAPTTRTVAFSSLELHPRVREKTESEAHARGPAPEGGRRGGARKKRAPENGHGPAPAAAADPAALPPPTTRDAIRKTLGLPPPPNTEHPRAQPGESYADTQKRLAAELAREG